MGDGFSEEKREKESWNRGEGFVLFCFTPLFHFSFSLFKCSQTLLLGNACVSSGFNSIQFPFSLLLQLVIAPIYIKASNVQQLQFEQQISNWILLSK